MSSSTKWRLSSNYFTWIRNNALKPFFNIIDSINRFIHTDFINFINKYCDFLGFKSFTCTVHDVRYNKFITSEMQVSEIAIRARPLSNSWCIFFFKSSKSIISLGTSLMNLVYILIHLSELCFTWLRFVHKHPALQEQLYSVGGRLLSKGIPEQSLTHLSPLKSFVEAWPVWPWPALLNSASAASNGFLINRTAPSLSFGPELNVCVFITIDLRSLTSFI